MFWRAVVDSALGVQPTRLPQVDPSLDDAVPPVSGMVDLLLARRLGWSEPLSPEQLVDGLLAAGSRGNRD
ncbi:hypothetical protein [Streptomyces turgidiscabies]|uniref:hypothetical protein n=1 Tax=Streptomyces turgidiscabies TaxID=85558 RepID=UPI0027D7F9BB|nr:hypothetical protein [Streptomyces turgidiscabies]